MLAGDAELARCAASHLTGLGGRFAVIAHATVTLGPVDRMLGLLALTQGDVEAAVTDLRVPPSPSPGRRRCGGPEAELALAIALRARGRPGDAAEAACLFDSVRSRRHVDAGASAVAPGAARPRSWPRSRSRR